MIRFLAFVVAIFLSLTTALPARAAFVAIKLTSGVQACSSGVTVGTLSLPTSGIAIRSSGVVPLGVQFDASATTSVGTTTQPFHEILYVWDFGDAGSGTWTSRTGGGNTSRNAAYGPIATHVFEGAGSYTITLAAFDGTNAASCSLSVTASGWTDDTNTVCVSTSGTFTGCAFGTQVTNSNWATSLGNISSTKKRILFRCGETWTANGFSLNTTGPGLIGAYNDSGMVTANNPTCTKPIVSIANATRALELNSSGALKTDWRVSDIDFRGNNGTATQRAISISESTSSGFDQLTVLRNNVQDINGNAFWFEWLGWTGHIMQEIYVVDSTVNHIIGGGGRIGIWAQFAKFALLGNSFTDSKAAEHLIRIQYGDVGVISNNKVVDSGLNALNGGAGDKEAMTLRGPCRGGTGCNFFGDSTHSTQKVVISDNLMGMSSNAIDSGWNNPVAIWPENADSNERIVDVIFERNYIAFSAMSVEGVQITLRNNIFENTSGTNTSYSPLIEVWHHTGSQIVPSDLTWIYNNTFYSGNSGSSAITAINVQSGVTNTSLKNNTAYAPSIASGSTAMITNSGTGTTGASGTQGNSSDSPTGGQVHGTSPLASVPPGTTITNWRALNYASGGGVTVPVWRDFNLSNVNSPRDAGALNH